MRWSTGRAVVCVACTTLLAIWASGGYAGDKRECTVEEKMGADSQLTAIAEDNEKEQGAD